MSTPPPEAVMQQLWETSLRGAGMQMYTILDAARNERIYPAVTRSGCKYQCLYQGQTAQELADVAPYLVHLPQLSPFCKMLLQEGWGDHWGIFLASASTLDELWVHFRRFTMVQNEVGQIVYFRYYDPRVLRVFLPTCNEAELSLVFGPVDSYLMESRDRTTLLRFLRSEGKLTENLIPLKA